MTSQKETSDKSDPPEVPQVLVAQAEAVAGSNIEDETSEHGRLATQRPSKASNSKDASSKRNQEPPIEQRPPPMFSNEYGQVDFDQDGLNTKATVASDGRLNININQKSRRLSDLLVPALRSQLNLQHVEEPATHPPGYIPPALGGQPGQVPPPPMNVVVHVVGSRGDVQPFIALGKVLKETYGHRVRLATHSTFRNFVEENGLEYFDIGGDPAELMAFMVKNPGLMPGMDSLKSGDVGKRRKGMYEIVQGCWRSCIEMGDGTGTSATDIDSEGRSSLDSGIGMENDSSAKPFVADAIIANPPSFAHIHCAEKLGIPLHIMFTMPWSPTQAFPHPLADIQSSNADSSLTNFVSYALVEMMTWQGLGDIINRFREKSLGLEPVSLMWAPGMASRLRIPYTYCWSPALIPKPKDWGPHISISGFFFLSLASSFTPESELEAFLQAGPPPVYIGFGSIVVDDPNAMTKLIFEAVRKTGQRALVSKGWGGFGADALGKSEGVFMLGNVPHDWLFQHVSCVVHHGGAGTTAAGIALGKPTVIVPFFGDQPFWGAMIAKAGAGPKPIPSKQLTADNLAAGILEALKPSTLAKAQELGAKISSEKGCDVGAKSFHDKLNVDSLRCALAPSRVAVWRVKRTQLRLSAFAAATLGNEGLLDFNDLKLYRPQEYESEDGPWDPISGGASAIIGTFGSLAMGFADFPVEILRALKIKSSEPGEQIEAATTSNIEILKSANLSRTSLDSTVKSAEPDGQAGGSTTSLPIEQSLSDPKSPASEGDPLSPRNSKSSYHPPRAMASALRGSLSRSSSRSRSRNSSPSRASTRSDLHQKSHSSQVTLEAVMGAGKSIRRIAGVGAKSPMDFTLSIARGFHNAPKLYGDQSVRQTEKITDFQSGLKVAGKEFGYGMFDGITGLVTQPIDGAKKEGIAGLIKGLGKGIGGVVLKPQAAAFGVPGYTLKGIYKEIQKHLGSSVQNYIIAARTTQGFQDWNVSTREERLDVISRWQAAQVELSKQKNHHRHDSFHCKPGFAKTRHLSFDERKKLAAEKKKRQGAKESEVSSPTEETTEPVLPSPNIAVSAPHHHPEEFEQAIHASVAATSRGNLEEDQMIERAIRASVKELQTASSQGDEEAAIQRAIKASIAEAQRGREMSAIGLDDDEERNRHLEESLQQSLQQHQSLNEIQSSPGPERDFDDSGIDTDGDEHPQTAMGKPKIDSEDDGTEDVDIKKAIEMSKEEHEDQINKTNASRMEEETVLEYVKKQSALEERLKQKMRNTQELDDDDEELKRAMQASLDLPGTSGEKSHD